ncbi:hypothetical protein ABPG72_000534 [Tetrahymena utriculariae]
MLLKLVLNQLHNLYQQKQLSFLQKKLQSITIKFVQFYCPSGYFKNSVNLIFTACSTNCKSCSDGKNCTQCDSSNGYKLQGSTCTICQQGCATCSLQFPDTCFSCENNLTKLDLLSMHDTKNEQMKILVLLVIEGENYKPYIINKLQICKAPKTCFYPCKNCYGKYQPTSCASCDENMQLTGTQQYIDCPLDKGYYFQKFKQDYGMCTKCPNGCKNCNQSSCLSCIDNYELVPNHTQHNFCLAKCSEGYFRKKYSDQFSSQNFAKNNRFNILLILLLISLSF